MREGLFDHPAVGDLLRLHLAEAHVGIPLENTHALDLDGLRSPAIRFFTLWEDGALMGMGAIRALAPGHAEIKSMRTHPDHLRKGVSRAILTHLLALARARGDTRVSLETGIAPSYAAANALYESAGFVDGPVFGGYPVSAHNRFMTLVLPET